MGNHEIGFAHHEVAVENQVEIESPRGAGVRTFATEALLDREERGQQIPRNHGCTADGSGVQKAWLITDTNGIGFVKPGETQIADVRSQRHGRVAQQPLPIAQIAAERDRDGGQFRSQ